MIELIMAIFSAFRCEKIVKKTSKLEKTMGKKTFKGTFKDFKGIARICGKL